ncbi:S24 family peptidase [Burkholderia cepacia]|uniref:S24 family peptidase n=1 Tax=Burkholderia cepacia TaxID=292 RepID=UPI00075B7A65|nr:S24 family peptidase [Burkholderia cepacia]KVF22914.1 hypothetical protein WJ06_10170 [Burkholderia cepacia]
MKTVIARLKHAVSYREREWGREIKKKELATAAGVSSAAVSNWWKNETTVLKADCVFGLASFLSIDSEWLQFGRGKMIDAPSKHISDVNGPTGTGQESALIEGLVSDSGTNIAKSPNKFDKNVEPAPRGQRSIPVISYVQAGMMTEAMDPFALGEGFETVVTDLDVSEGSFWLKIKGISMLPEFPEGDMVLIDPSVTPLPGDFVVAKNTEEEATFKKYRPRGTNDRGEATFELVPLNDDFPTLYSERDHLRVIGVMMEHRKYRRR